MKFLIMKNSFSVQSHQLNLPAGVFFIGYALFQIPSNLCLVKVGATTWLAGMLIVWGIVAVLSASVNTVPQFLTARFLLGVAECGAFPGTQSGLGLNSPQALSIPYHAVLILIGVLCSVTETAVLLYRNVVPSVTVP